MSDAACGFETIVVERHGAIAVVALNRPERLNAMNKAMVGELGQALDALEGDAAVRAIVVHGIGRAFCSGFDLKEGVTQKREGRADWEEVYTRDLDVVMRFWRLSKPTIAAVHGYCLAGGFELALACDVTIAGADARMGSPELRFGSGIVALLLPWLTGPKKAKELLLTGADRITAEEAVACGLINRVAAEGAHLEEALAVARQIAVMDSAAVRLTKAAINEAYEIMGLGKALAAGVATGVSIELMETEERRTFNEIARTQGLKAAVAWRDARFA